MARRLLTPNEVRTSTLHATWLRGGYDTDETDELLDDCAYTIQVLTEKIAELMPAYCGMLDSNDHAIVDGALNAITSLRKIAMQGHNMLTASETVADADRIDNLKAVFTPEIR